MQQSGRQQRRILLPCFSQSAHHTVTVPLLALRKLIKQLIFRWL
jgi:hypothetical protein